MNSFIEKLKIPPVIVSDFERNRWVYIILFIGFIPMALRGYSMYLLFLLVPLMLKTTYSINSLIVILFSVLYAAPVMYRGETLTMSQMVFMLSYPIILYQAAEYIGRQVKSVRTVSLLMVLISIMLAFPAIFYNILDYLRTGELVNAKRAVEAASGQESGATHYGIMLSLCLGMAGVTVLSTNNRYDTLLKMVIVGFSFLAVLSTIHLVNRSGLYIAAFSVVAGAVLPPFTRKRVMYAMLIFIACYLIYIIYLEMTPLLKEAIESYQYRDATQASTKSLGGRDNLWRQGVQHLYDFPWGGGKSIIFHGHESYAHNMWIDCGVTSGLPAFFLLLVITFRYIVTSFRFLFYKTEYTFDRNILVMILATFMIQCMVEPVIEGLAQYFWAWIFCWGLLTSFLNHQQELSEEAHS